MNDIQKINSEIKVSYVENEEIIRNIVKDKLVKKVSNLIVNENGMDASNVTNVEYILKSIDLDIDKYLIKNLKKADIEKALQEVILSLISKKSNDKKISLFDDEEKVIIENNIKKKICSFFKESIGKGPQKVEVIFKNNILQIKTYDILTVMEKSLLENSKNRTLIEYNRRLFYKNKRCELEKLLSNVIKKASVIKKIDINVSKNVDSITCKFN